MATSNKTAVLKLLRAQRTDDARKLCEQMVSVHPDDAGLWGLLGAIYGMLNNPGQAEWCAREAVRCEPGYATAHYNLGLALRLQGRAHEAILSLEQAVRLKPDYADAHYNLGKALAQVERPDEATLHYQMALVLHPGDAEVLNDLGIAMADTGHGEDAITNYRLALEQQPDFLPAQRNLAKILLDLGRWEEALTFCRSTLQIHPNDTDMLVNLGVALERCGHRDEALTTYRRAIAIKSDNAEAHFNLSLMLLGQASFREGWREYAWAWQREGARRRPFAPSPWDGSDLKGCPVFLHAEQGLGDELFFLRFVPWLRQRGVGRVVYRSQPKIATLLSRVTTLDAILTADAKPSADDMIFAIGDLPRLLGMEWVDQIPPSIVLTAQSGQLSAMQARLATLGPPPYIGLTWRGGTKDKKNVLYKECPLPEFARVLKQIPGTLLVLQRQPQPGEIESFAQELGRPMHDLSALNDDLEQMLALLTLLDDYVGVSNTNMHLRAGAGKTAKVLVPAPPEWRWMAEGTESPWFPGFRVYRQGVDGDWTQALAQIESDLRDASGHGRR